MESEPTKFFITSLELVKPDDPHEFMIVLSYPENEQTQKSDIINSDKIQSHLPIKFNITKKSVIVKLIEIQKAEPDNTNERQRGHCTITIQDEKKEQQVEIVEDKGAQQKETVCKIKYKCKDGDQNESQNGDKEGQGNKNQQAGQQNNNNEKQNQDNKNDPNNPNENPEDNTENKGQKNGQGNKKNYDQLLKQLNEIKVSVQKMMDKAIKQQQVQNQGKQQNFINKYFEKGDQSDAVKWYKKRYSKDKPVNPYPEPTGQNNCQNQYDPQIQYDGNQTFQNGENIQFFNLSFRGQIKPKNIAFMQKQKGKPIISITCPQGEGSKCKKVIELPQTKLIYIVITNISQIQFESCLEMAEEKTKKLPVFDSEGEVVGILSFDCKKLGIKCVQTFQELVQNQELTERSNKEQQLEQKSRVRKNREYSEDEEQYQSYRPLAPRQKSQKMDQGYNKLDQIRIPGKIRSSYNKDNDQKTSELYNSRAISRYQQKQYKAQNRPQSRRKLKNNPYFQSDRYLTVPNDQSPRDNKSINNSTSVYFTPLKKENFVEKQKRNNSSINSYNEFPKREKTPTHYVSFKIHNASVRLDNFPEMFVGKFLKIQVKGAHPFITQMISLTKHLNWKIKGCYFQKISLFDQILVNIYSEQTQFPKLQGTARIRIALLSLDEISKIQFYREYVRNSQMKQIGQIILGYQIMEAPSRPDRKLNRVHTESIQKPISSSNNLKSQKLKINLKNYNHKNDDKRIKSPVSESRAKNSSSGRLVQKPMKFKNRPIKVIDQSGSRSIRKY